MSGRVTDDPSRFWAIDFPQKRSGSMQQRRSCESTTDTLEETKLEKSRGIILIHLGKPKKSARKSSTSLDCSICREMREWCSDSYRDDFYSLSTGKNPYNNEVSSFRVSRGGGFSDSEICLRVESRFHYNVLTAAKDLGFRVCRTLF